MNKGDVVRAQQVSGKQPKEGCTDPAEQTREDPAPWPSRVPEGYIKVRIGINIEGSESSYGNSVWIWVPQDGLQ